MTSSRTIACVRGIDCEHDAAGHKMTFMRQRMGHLDAANFVNARLVDFDGEWAVLEDVFTGERLLAWNHEDLRTVLWGGDLVSVSVQYNMLAIRNERYNVLVQPQVTVDDSMFEALLNL